MNASAKKDTIRPSKPTHQISTTYDSGVHQLKANQSNRVHANTSNKTFSFLLYTFSARGKALLPGINLGYRQFWVQIGSSYPPEDHNNSSPIRTISCLQSLSYSKLHVQHCSYIYLIYVDNRHWSLSSSVDMGGGNQAAEAINDTHYCTPHIFGAESFGEKELDVLQVLMFLVCEHRRLAKQMRTLVAVVSHGDWVRLGGVEPSIDSNIAAADRQTAGSHHHHCFLSC